jgi:hypothetical protein
MADEHDERPSKDLSKDMSNAQLVSWARKRGLVTFFIFFSIGVGVAAFWYLTR